MTTVRSIVVVTVKERCKIFHLDANNTFLLEDLHEEIYMKVPPSLAISDPYTICNFKRSLYSLKQASRQWYSKLSDALKTRDYHNSKHGYSLFYKEEND